MKIGNNLKLLQLINLIFFKVSLPKDSFTWELLCIRCDTMTKLCELFKRAVRLMRMMPSCSTILASLTLSKNIIQWQLNILKYAHKLIKHITMPITTWLSFTICINTIRKQSLFVKQQNDSSQKGEITHATGIGHGPSLRKEKWPKR